MHFRGWNIDSWCSHCRINWEENCGQLYCKGYERAMDMELARTVCLEMEAGTVDIPAEYLNLDLSEVVRTAASPPVPSAN